MKRGAREERGILIVFEGIDGAGKSTQVERLARTLRVRGFDVTATREPTTGPHGTRIRQAARTGRRPSPEEELAWFVADRRDHVERVIAPALVAGRVVLSDRYFLSTVAYQGAAGLDPDRLLRQAEAEFPTPDLALLFELDAAQGLERVAARGGGRDAGFEDEEILRGVARIFSEIEREYVARIDAGGSSDAVHASVVEAVDRVLPSLAESR